MKSLMYCFTLYTYLFAHVGSTQQIEQIGSSYQYNGQSYEKKEMREIFLQVPQALDYYEKSIKSQKSGALTTTAGAATGTIGFLIFVGSNKSTGNSNQLGSKLLVAVFGGISAILFFVGIGVSSSSDSYMQKAIDQFNWQFHNKMNKETSSLQL